VDPEGTALAARVSTIPGVSTALRAYEQSKASSRVVKVMLQLRVSIERCDLYRVVLVRRRDDGIFSEEYIAARHRPLTGYFSRGVCLSAT